MVTEARRGRELDRHAASILATLDRRRNRERLDRLAHVVRAEHPRAALERRDRGSQRRRERAGRRLRIAEHLAERALAREPDEHGAAERHERVEAAQELEVLVGRLPEADARVDADPLLGDAAARPRTRPAPRGRPTHRPRRRRIEGDLHRPRLALHVHETDDTRHASATTSAMLRVAAKRGDVVDDLGAELQRAPRDDGLGGVDRDRESREAPRAPARCARAPPRPRRGAAPGRVDSPPTSTSAAPSAASRLPWSTAAPGSTKRPPSEKLSGVTLSTPITDGRGQRSSNDVSAAIARSVAPSDRVARIDLHGHTWLEHAARSGSREASASRS